MRGTFIGAVATCVVTLAAAPCAWAVCRVVQPSEDSGLEPVAFDPTTTVLYISAPEQIVDYSCYDAIANASEITMDQVTLPVLGSAWEYVAETADMSGQSNAGTPQPNPYFDVEQINWAYQSGVDIPYDPSVCPDGSLADPVLDNLIHVVIRPSIYASGGNAGLIMPLPARADVHLAPEGILEEVADLRLPMVVEEVTYIEDDSLGAQCSDPHYSSLNPIDTVFGAPSAIVGCGDSSGDGSYYRPGLEDYDAETWTQDDVADGGIVQFENIPVSGDYDVTILNASDLDALIGWLDENSFAHSQTDDEAFGHYVTEGAWFMAVHVHPQATTGARIDLEPLVVTWRGDEIPIQNRLTYEPLGASLVNDTFILAPEGMAPEQGGATALYRSSAAIPWSPRVASFGRFEARLTHLEMTRATSVELADSRFVPETRQIRPTVNRSTTVRIAAACCGNTILTNGRQFTETYTYLEGTREPGGEFFNSPSPTEQQCADNPSYYGGDEYSCVTAGQVSAAAGWAPWLLGLVFLQLAARRKRLRDAASFETDIV